MHTVFMLCKAIINKAFTHHINYSESYGREVGHFIDCGLPSPKQYIVSVVQTASAAQTNAVNKLCTTKELNNNLIHT